jgi:hypothetical protein
MLLPDKAPGPAPNSPNLKIPFSFASIFVDPSISSDVDGRIAPLLD